MKRKTLLSLIVAIALGFSVKAQNLVTNYSFEDTIKCSEYGEFGGYVTDWGGGFPGYFSPYCSDAPEGGMPQNAWGYQYPHSGNSYAGIYTFIDSAYDSFNANLRDYIQDSLVSKLKNGVKYFVTFYINLGDSEKYACNSIGAYFSDSSLNFSSRKVLSYHIPQVENDTSNHLTDKIKWMKVSGSFVAQGGEQYMIIGNFKNDAHSDTIFVNSVAHTENIWTNAYYYVDDVIVTTDSNYADSLFPNSVSSITMPQDEAKVYPNPSNGKFTIGEQGVRDKEQVEIYNMFGKRVYNEALRPTSFRGRQAKGDIQIDLSNQPAGIYLYRITSEKGEAIGSGKLIIQ